ncbi:MAG: sigma-70 family RNA polymerase sigma factor [Candidatus Paceibacterota bacterium]|jgi:RNA polymerase sigma-70 factor (ECF subfamily)
MLFNEDDEEIIALYKNGDQEAFKGLISRYSSPLYNFTARLTDKNNASDVVQETFIKVWKNLHKFDPSKASFKTWIFTIAKNTATDFLRKKKSLSFSDMEESINKDGSENINSFSENIPDEELIPDEALQKLQDSMLLNKVLDKLPIHYKTILVLHYQEDMTFDEIGKVLDKPLNTVKSQHHRAIVLLRKMID